MDEYICGLQMIREGMRQGLLSANHFLLSFVLLCSIIHPICFISDTHGELVLMFSNRKVH